MLNVTEPLDYCVARGLLDNELQQGFNEYLSDIVQAVFINYY